MNLYEKTGVRVVQLSVNYETSVQEMLAQFSDRGCKLVRVNETDSKVTTFVLTNEELNALVETALQYHEDKRLAEEALQAKIDSIIAQAKEIVAQNAGIKIREIESGNGACWEVSVPDAGWELLNPSYTARDFLTQVQMAAKVWQDHIKELARQDEFLLQALKLAKTIPGIRIREEAHPTGFHKIRWYVDHEEFSIALGWALSAEQFYKDVKEVERIWNELHPEESAQSQEPVAQ
jgi:hypothetical protein